MDAMKPGWVQYSLPLGWTILDWSEKGTKYEHADWLIHDATLHPWFVIHDDRIRAFTKEEQKEMMDNAPKKMDYTSFP